METARRVNSKGCQAPKMGVMSINGRLVLVPQNGDKLRVNVIRVARQMAGPHGLNLNNCLRF